MIKKLATNALTLYQSGIISQPSDEFFRAGNMALACKKGNMANSEESPATNVLVEAIAS
ncbi:MAG: hypothetical protein MUW55_01715 [Pantoea vagans]|nr:hypothetical protein [Pantoea vagans]